MAGKTIDTDYLPGGTIHRTIGLLQKALNHLNADIELPEIERIGIMVNRAMSMQQRSFHTPEHIFNLADPEDAHGTLAALFHDIVYFQVDEGFLDDIKSVLNPYIIVSHGSVRIRDQIPGDDRVFFGTAAVFAFSPGQSLSPFTGLNEFLSALVMNCLLEGVVREKDLLIATAGIEMTIPFRGMNDQGKSPAELLEVRIRNTVKEFDMGLSDDEIHRTVISAVRFANRDVNNFAEEDPGVFLDNTWKLLPESNSALRVQGLYTIRNYSTALMKMEGFLSNLDPGCVFQSYNGYPEKTEYDSLLTRVSRNLETARVYLGVKMIAAGLLLALAELTGGDIPISYIMGDIDPDDDRSSLAAHLPEDPPCPGKKAGKDSTMNRLLEHGRTGSSAFDLQNSPLSLFVYRCLDENKLMDYIRASREFLAGKRDAEDYLKSFPSLLVEAIARAAAVMAFTRREKLAALADRFTR